MQRSKQIAIGAALAAALFVFGGASPAPKPYHLELEAYPAAPFPWFSKFGTIDIHVYPHGVRAESMFLNGFSRAGTKTLTMMNPIARMYADVPLSRITSMISEASTESDIAAGTPPVQTGVVGKIGGLPVARYRLVYGPEAWIDIWTTREVPENAQLRAVVDSLIRGVSVPTANVARTIPGTPLYVELNFRRFKKTPFLRLKKLTWNASGETDALKVGSYYFKAPLADAIFRP